MPNVISLFRMKRTISDSLIPQSFKIEKLLKLINNLTDDEKEILTDACKIFTLQNEDVHLVEGEVTNIKITYP